ncbi:MAG: PD40 domain-containing protein [Saprospiraceae bacterium]|nr:PD40 domain-containing protein [Saprospiraceae bacterium]
MELLSMVKSSFYRCIIFLFLPLVIQAQGVEGYYRDPAIFNDQVVFSSEGDLWLVSLSGGLAQRLTSHLEEERFPAFSPDGSQLAFSASYEGPMEVYTMPISGGLPTRLTYEEDPSQVNTWSSNGWILYDSRAQSTLPDRQLFWIDAPNKTKGIFPLSQASEASYDPGSKTVFFVRPSYHGNVTKRYKGGTARQVWKYTEGAEEAIRLTVDYPGESHHPLYYDSRVYFISDRDGTMNIWSVDIIGKDLQQHTFHKDFDVRSANLHQGQLVYQWGADIWHLNLATGIDQKIPIRLRSDLEQIREKWVENPAPYITSMHADSAAERLVITARGRIFVAPVDAGRWVSFTDPANVRYRDAVFSADGKYIMALSDESGEFEFIQLPADGIGKLKAISHDGSVLRYAGVPSPDGKWLAYDDLENHLYLLNISTGESRLISTNEEGIRSFRWSADSQWLAFEQQAENTMMQIWIYDLSENSSFAITSDRANSLSPSWSDDGRFIYFLSDRNFQTLVGSPWGSRQPEPYFVNSEKLYYIALQPGNRSPFRPDDELFKKDKDQTNKDSLTITIDKRDIINRLEEVPVKAGNYSNLSLSNGVLYMISRDGNSAAGRDLVALKIENQDVKLITLLEGINGYELSPDGSKLVLDKQNSIYVVPAKASKISDLNESKVDMSDWRFSIDPKEDWKQMFTDAWRMERDYFYDQHMHGVNWQAMYDKYLPLVDRVHSREELSDLIGRYVGELAALHTSVRGGDVRSDDKDITVAGLGARLSRQQNAGGFKIDYIYQSDPDYPDERSPLADPYLNIQVGDMITMVNGRDALSVFDLGELIRDQEGKQVRLQIKRDGKKREVIVVPIANTYDLRYRDWEYTRRLAVERATDSQVGYVHLRAMGPDDINQWYREFYPVFDRGGLIIDVRHNRGGNIESFILEKLLRKAWMYWKSRSGKPYWNMQYAFRGHIVILVDENTASDGEAFADGFKKLNLGAAIGVRTWGGEIWLSGANRLTDGGLARAPMMGVYGPDGDWLIEGHGFEPDIVVENLPHQTFLGEDAQLEAGIKHLQKLMSEDPRPVPAVPAYPDKSFNNKD